MDDLISRQAAIEALGEMPEVWEEDDDEGRGEQNQWYMDKIAIEALPTAEPRKGKWKISDLPKGQMKYCSECGFGQYIADMRTYHYCPNCGARMEESDDKGNGIRCMAADPDRN